MEEKRIGEMSGKPYEEITTRRNYLERKKGSKRKSMKKNPKGNHQKRKFP